MLATGWRRPTQCLCPAALYKNEWSSWHSLCLTMISSSHRSKSPTVCELRSTEGIRHGSQPTSDRLWSGDPTGMLAGPAVLDNSHHQARPLRGPGFPRSCGAIFRLVPFSMLRSDMMGHIWRKLALPEHKSPQFTGCASASAHLPPRFSECRWQS